MIKVLHIIQGYGGGVSSLVKNLVLHEDKTQLSQDVLSFAYINGEAFVEELTRHGSRVMLMPRPRKEGMAAFRKAVLSVMKDGAYDVVHCHTDGWRSTIFKKLANKAGIPLFCIHAHRSTNDLSKIKNHPLYLRFNRRISCKNADIRFSCGDKASAFIYGTADDTVIVPNGIDPMLCKAAAAVDTAKLKAELGISDNVKVLLHAGRLVTAKNHMFLLDIAERLREQQAAFVLLIVGAGDLEDSIRRAIEERQLSDCVRMLGRRNDVLALMRMADMMLLPSFSEGLPTVAVEAQAMGCYSLLSDTITTECDMGLQTVRYLPIGNTAPLWAQEIVRYQSGESADVDRILQQLETQAYTSDGAVHKYTEALTQAVQARRKG